ncbi:MAG TPA: hypothetical protein VND64_31815 [Pirellulales bacterium]|nr:hypothetical protein [Pirellulales bacterium]
MVDPVMISFHEDSCREYLDYWCDPARREAAEMEENDAAYHVLEHAALLVRCVPRGSSQVIRQVEGLAVEERVRLVRVASQFASQFSLSDYCKRLFRQEVLDVDDMAEIEVVLIQRDALDAVLDFAARLVTERIEEDDDLLADLARAHCTADELDDTLLSRPDIIAPASRILDQTCPPASAGLWLRKAREYDERFQEPTLAEFRRSVAESTSDAGTGDLPHAVSLLLRRTQEIAAQAAEFRIAASAGGRVGPAADELLESTYPVEGDDAVKVRFSIEPGSNCRHQFRIVLVAPMPALERYRSAAIKFNDGSVCSMALGLGAGGVELSVDEITVVTSLMLVEESGERRHVDINACHE